MTVADLPAVGAAGFALLAFAAFAWSKGAGAAGATFAATFAALGAALAATGRSDVGAGLALGGAVSGAFAFAIGDVSAALRPKPPLRAVATAALVAWCLTALYLAVPAEPRAPAMESAPFPPSAMLAAAAGAALALVFAFGRGERSLHNSEHRP